MGKCLPHAETAGRLCRGMSVSAEGAAPSPGPPASSQAGCPGLICEDPVLSEGPVLTPRCHCSLLQGVTTTHGRQEGRPGPSTCLCDVCPVVSPTRPGLGGRMLTPKGTGPGHPGCWASNVDRPWARPGASSQVLQVQARVGVGPARGAPGDQGAKLQASHRAGTGKEPSPGLWGNDTLRCPCGQMRHLSTAGCAREITARLCEGEGKIKPPCWRLGVCMGAWPAHVSQHTCCGQHSSEGQLCDCHPRPTFSR